MLKTFIKKYRKLVLGVATAFVVATPVAAKENFRMSTLGPGTSPFLTMSTFANIVNKNLPEYSIQVNATGAATKHALDVAKGKSDFFMNSPVLYSFLSQQKAMYKKIKNAPELAQNLKSMLNFPMGIYHAVTYADSGINSLADLKGKRVFAGPPGGVARRTSETIIKLVTGLEAGKDYESVKLSWDAASQSFLDGHIDVYFNPTNAPSPAIQHFTLSKKVRFLGIPKEKLDAPGVKKLASRPGYRIGKLEPGIYGKNQVNTEEVYSIKVTIGIATNKDMSEEVIYNMTKTFWDELDKVKKDTPWLRNIIREQALQDLNMPLHPGARKYYEEIGMAIPEIKVPGT